MRKIKNRIKSFLLNYLVSRVSKEELLCITLNDKERQVLNFITHGYLKDIGWWKSWENKSPVSQEGKPIPWVTYSFIDFVAERLRKDMVVFEFGSGNSTLYYSKKVARLDSVEHDELWYANIKSILPSNANLYYQVLEINGAYSKRALQSDIKYDLISIDGRDRANCMLNSIDALNETGVIVLDDSERISYLEAIEEILRRGFKRIDFWGISPGFMDYNKCTTIFYRSFNVLDI